MSDFQVAKEADITGRIQSECGSESAYIYPASAAHFLQMVDHSINFNSKILLSRSLPLSA